MINYEKLNVWNKGLHLHVTPDEDIALELYINLEGLNDRVFKFSDYNRHVQVDIDGLSCIYLWLLECASKLRNIEYSQGIADFASHLISGDEISQGDYLVVDDAIFDIIKEIHKNEDIIRSEQFIELCSFEDGDKVESWDSAIRRCRLNTDEWSVKRSLSQFFFDRKDRSQSQSQSIIDTMSGSIDWDE